jgi:23S rRNA (cytidine2498-2'-O)-methyltransferase
LYFADNYSPLSGGITAALNRTSTRSVDDPGGRPANPSPAAAGEAAGSPPPPVFWYRNSWLEPFRLEFASIGEAAAVLRSIQRNWAALPLACFRRAALIGEKLPPLSARPRPFPWIIPAAPVGNWTLLDGHTLIGSSRCSSPFPGGIIEFDEDKNGPPSRAYLKLWEALTRLGRRPGPGDRCLDAGASPGGWTWALARLGAEVIAVDRAPLEERIGTMPGVTYIKHDAFTLRPEDIGPVDWLFSDVICYPPRLYEWVAKWLASGLCRNFVCTIKLQGTPEGREVDFETPRRFAAIPGGQVVHLYHNKHELTWMTAPES